MTTRTGAPIAVGLGTICVLLALKLTGNPTWAIFLVVALYTVVACCTAGIRRLIARWRRSKTPATPVLTEEARAVEAFRMRQASASSTVIMEALGYPDPESVYAAIRAGVRIVAAQRHADHAAVAKFVAGRARLDRTADRFAAWSPPVPASPRNRYDTKESR